jgi:hypothetical protein
MRLMTFVPGMMPPPEELRVEYLEDWRSLVQNEVNTLRRENVECKGIALGFRVYVSFFAYMIQTTNGPGADYRARNMVLVLDGHEATGEPSLFGFPIFYDPGLGDDEVRALAHLGGLCLAAKRRLGL